MKERTYNQLTETNQKRDTELAEKRLTREEQLRVIQWFVELRSTQEIKDLIKEEFGKDIARMSVWRYRNCKKWKPVIERLRNRFEKNLLKIPIANKVDRLRILQKVVKEGLKWSLKTITKDGDEIYELKLSNVTQAIKEAREEMEGDSPLIDNSTHFHITKEEAIERTNRLKNALSGNLV